MESASFGRRAAGFGLLAIALGACHTGDVAGNATRNLFGGRGGKAADVVAAGVTGFVDLVHQMNTQFSPEQEHYLGRGVAANFIAQYGLDPDEGRQEYVRKIGQGLVTLAPRIRSTYGGYHFAVLNSPTVNGMSGPGGYVFVTRGALDAAKSEDEVAGLLAHEIAHVSLKHGEAVVRKSGNFQAGIGALGRVVGAAAGGGQFEQRMYDLFSQTASGFARDLASQGYGSDLEFKADAEGTYILYEANYDAASISHVLANLPAHPAKSWTAHPGNEERIARLSSLVAEYGGRSDPAGLVARAARFAQPPAPKQ